jgi:two-component system, NtrC family, sensor kinase
VRSVASKIFLTFAIALAAFAGAAGFGAARLHALGQDLQVISDGYLPLTRIAAQLDVKDWVTSRVLEAGAMDPAARRAWLPLARAHFPAVVREKVAEGRTVARRAGDAAPEADRKFLDEVAGRLAGLDRRWAEYHAASMALFDALEAGGEGAGGQGLEPRAQAVRQLEKALSLEVKLLQVSLDSQVTDRVQAARRAERRTVALIVIYTLLAGAVGVAAAVVAQRLLLPIRTLTEGVKAVAAGDLTRTVEVRADDEIGLLAREFNAMAASLERQRRELLRAERLATVGRISAQITHEIRNPLNAIGLNAELLAEELEQAAGRTHPAGLAEARHLVAAIGAEVDRLHAVTEEYLRFARLPKPVFGREELNEILAGLVDFLRGELARAQVRVELELAAGLPPVRADEGQLRAAFLNLLRNSREAMAGGGRVTVRTRAVEGGVEAEVEDTGAGIPAERLPRIFEPFYSTKERGTGLGLAFAQQVVQEHGGSIRCDSRVGQGTRFTVRLPAAAEERAGAPAAVASA